jgi:hypothetical protein
MQEGAWALPGGSSAAAAAGDDGGDGEPASVTSRRARNGPLKRVAWAEQDLVVVQEFRKDDPPAQVRKFDGIDVRAA